MVLSGFEPRDTQLLAQLGCLLMAIQRLSPALLFYMSIYTYDLMRIGVRHY